MRQIEIVTPGPNGSLLDEYGHIVTPPNGWKFLPAGDAGVTRKVTSKGNYWKVQFKKGRRIMSKGVWAPSEIIDSAIKETTAVRQTDSYKRKQEKAHFDREKKQQEYKSLFKHEVTSYLAFSPEYKQYETKLAHAITEHATPVGSGTVARTSMIPIEERAARAVIAWMRHQATNYDSMKIPRVKGERREVRRILAQYCKKILHNYRSGQPIPPTCPLKKVLDSL